MEDLLKIVLRALIEVLEERNHGPRHTSQRCQTNCRGRFGNACDHKKCIWECEGWGIPDC